MRKTPNSLPSTVLSLGKPFMGTALTLPSARQVMSVEHITIGSKESNATEGKPKGHYPYHLIDFRGEGKVITRSEALRVTKRELESIKRELESIKRGLVRKLAVYLWENKHVTA